MQAKYRNLGDKYQLIFEDGKVLRYTDLYYLVKDVNTHGYTITNIEAIPEHFRNLITK